MPVRGAPRPMGDGAGAWGCKKGELLPLAFGALPTAAPAASPRPRRPAALACRALLQLTRSPPHPPALGSPAPALDQQGAGAERVSERSCPVPQISQMKTRSAWCARSGRDVGEVASRAGAGAPCVPGRVGPPRPRGASISKELGANKGGKPSKAPPQLPAASPQSATACATETNLWGALRGNQPPHPRGRQWPLPATTAAAVCRWAPSEGHD